MCTSLFRMWWVADTGAALGKGLRAQKMLLRSAAAAHGVSPSPITALLQAAGEDAPAGAAAHLYVAGRSPRRHVLANPCAAISRAQDDVRQQQWCRNECLGHGSQRQERIG